MHQEVLKLAAAKMQLLTREFACFSQLDTSVRL